MMTPTGVGPGAGGGGAARPNSSQATSSSSAMPAAAIASLMAGRLPANADDQRIALDRVNPLMNVHGHASTSGTEPRWTPT